MPITLGGLGSLSLTPWRQGLKKEPHQRLDLTVAIAVILSNNVSASKAVLSVAGRYYGLYPKTTWEIICYLGQQTV